MYEWHRQIQRIVDDMDRCIQNRDDDGLTLKMIAKGNGYSEFHMTRKFKELAGISLRDYLWKRRLAFALINIRDTDKSIIEIAIEYSFSSHEAFSRSFKTLYGIRQALTELRRDQLFCGQIMAHIFENGKTAEAYGVRLPADYRGKIPPQMTLLEVPASEYAVFEHGRFDYEQESEAVGINWKLQ